MAFLKLRHKNVERNWKSTAGNRCVWQSVKPEYSAEDQERIEEEERRDQSVSEDEELMLEWTVCVDACIARL